MTFEDRYLTPTPEGVSLDVVLAGLGSRFVALLLDSVIQLGALIGIIFIVERVVGGGGETSELVGDGIISLAVLLLLFGYFVACEMMWSGRSVGKRAAGIRVMRRAGTAIGFWSSVLRNLARLVDVLPNFYLLGSILILATPRNQRLGDLLADTVVVRERLAGVTSQRGRAFDDRSAWLAPVGAPGVRGAPSFGATSWLPPDLAHWDVSAVGESDLVLVRAFLAHRDGYTPEARHRLALQLADRLWPMVAGPATPPHPEQFLEAVLLVKSARR